MKISYMAGILIPWTVSVLFPLLAGGELIFNGFNNSSTAFDSGSAISAVWDYEPLNPLITAGAGYAEKFTAMAGPGDWSLEAVVLPVSYWNQLNVRISIVADGGNTPTGAVIWSVTNPSQITTDSGVRTLPASGTLVQGGIYWLVVEPNLTPADETVDVYIQWNLASPSRVGMQARRLYDEGLWAGWTTGRQETAACAFNIHGNNLGGGSASGPAVNEPAPSCKQRCAKSRNKLNCWIACVKEQVKGRLSKTKSLKPGKMKFAGHKKAIPLSSQKAVSTSGDCGCFTEKSVVMVETTPDFTPGQTPSMVFSWTHVPGLLYEIQYATSLTATGWSVLKTLNADESSEGRFIHPMPTDEQNYYYRVVATRPGCD